MANVGFSQVVDMEVGGEKHAFFAVVGKIFNCGKFFQGNLDVNFVPVFGYVDIVLKDEGGREVISIFFEPASISSRVKRFSSSVIPAFSKVL